MQYSSVHFREYPCKTNTAALLSISWYQKACLKDATNLVSLYFGVVGAILGPKFNMTNHDSDPSVTIRPQLIGTFSLT